MKSGLSFFYLPDQDHGREASLFAPFFHHPKATLPAPPRLVKLTGARALPVLACYDEQAHGYRLEVEAPYADYPSADLMADTCRMNDSVERQLCRHPASTCGSSKIFDTREDQVGPDGLYEEGSGASAGALLLILSLALTRCKNVAPSGPLFILTCLISDLARGAVQGQGRKSCQDH